MPNLPVPSVSSIDTDAMRYAEVGRQADQSKTPIQFTRPFESGVAAGNTLEGIRQDKEKKAKAAQFQQILDAGLPAMQQAWQELGPDGQKRVPDPSLFTDSREASVSWWKLATETHGRTQAGSALAQGNYDEAAGAAVASGISADPSSDINSARTDATKEVVRKKKEDDEARQQKIFSDWRNVVSPILKKKGYSLDDAAMNEISDSFPTELSGYKPAEDYRDNLVKKNSSTSAGNLGLKESGQLFTQEQKLADDFKNETKNFQPALTSYAKTIGAVKQNNPLDAYAAIINFVKTLDPTSTVREGEKMTAENSAAGGKWEAFKKWANQIADGQLTPEVRKNLFASAKQLIDAEYKGYTRVRKKYQGIIAGYAKDGYKFNEARILGDTADDINSVIDMQVPGISPEPSPAAAKPKGPLKVGRFQVEVGPD